MIPQPDPSMDDGVRGSVADAEAAAYTRVVELSPGPTLIQASAMPGGVLGEGVMGAGAPGGEIGQSVTIPVSPDRDSSMLGWVAPK